MPSWIGALCVVQVREEVETEKRELVVALKEARTAALDYLRQLREARREAIDNSELAVTWQAKAEEMTDEERVGRRAQELLAQQQAREDEVSLLLTSYFLLLTSYFLLLTWRSSRRGRTR